MAVLLEAPMLAVVVEAVSEAMEAALPCVTEAAH
jgi:hypothetical protein